MSNILTQEDKKLLEGLINTYSPSGDEDTICKFIKDYYHVGNATVINKQINSKGEWILSIKTNHCERCQVKEET